MAALWKATVVASGQGSEFVVRLPLAKDGCRVMSGEKVESNGEALIIHASPLGTKKRILVVDDNVDSAESLTRLLDLSGNETRTAYDGLEAAAAFRPDAILLDIGLPELNGYEVAPQDTGAAMGGENYVGGRDGLGAGRGPPSLARSRFGTNDPAIAAPCAFENPIRWQALFLAWPSSDPYIGRCTSVVQPGLDSNLLCFDQYFA
jgi:hypothetical protein